MGHKPTENSRPRHGQTIRFWESHVWVSCIVVPVVVIDKVQTYLTLENVKEVQAFRDLGFEGLLFLMWHSAMMPSTA